MRKLKLILCEGKHDRIFFEKLFPKLEIPVSEVKFFDQGTTSKLKGVKNHFTHIRSFKAFLLGIYFIIQ